MGEVVSLINHQTLSLIFLLTFLNNIFMKQITIFLISALVFLNNAHSQEIKANYSHSQPTEENKFEVIKSNYYKYASENMTSLKEDQIYKLLRYKLNLKKVNEINELIDDDIVNIVLNRNQDYKSKAILRPQVIMGTVVSQTYDTREDAFFHTEWVVRIDEIIADDGNIIRGPSGKNLVEGDNVYIKSMTGMIGNKYRNITHMKKLFIGEKVFLFIAPVKNLGYKRFLKELEMLKNFNISSIDNLDKSFTMTGGFSIKFDNVYDMDDRRIGPLKDVKLTTQQIIEFNRKAQFDIAFSRGK